MFSNHVGIRQNRRGSSPLTLSWSQYVVIVSGLCALTAVMMIGLGPYGVSEAFHRFAVRQYERDFGFEVGLVRGWPRNSDHGIWGIARVTSEGRMDREAYGAGSRVQYPRYGIRGLASCHDGGRRGQAGLLRCE